MIWLILLILIMAGFLALLGRNYWKERRYLKKSTGEAMDPNFRRQIEDESEDFARRQRKFQKKLKNHGA